MTTNLRKVSPGDALRIPASAYNAFVDAAVDLRVRQGRADVAAAGALESSQRGVVLVRNDSGEAVEPHHTLAITGVLIEPGTEDRERTFHGRTPLTADVADEQSPPLAMVVAMARIDPGKLGRCVVHGVTPARVMVQDEADTTCELRAGETLPHSTPLGGAPILWKEDGTGEKWAVIELGRPSHGRITAVLGDAQPLPGEENRWRYPWREARLDGDAGSDTFMRYVPVPDGLSSRSTGGSEDPARMAINRFEAHHTAEPVPAGGFGGLLGVGPVCELPGVLPKCPPARSLVPRLVPIPAGVCVLLTCERDSKGQPVWVFEAMSLVELADPGDGDRKFNLYIPGGGG